MLRSMKELERYKVSATDGDLGSVDNFLVEDTSWAVRYLVMDTGGPLGGRRVLIPQLAFREVDYSARRFRLALSRTKIQESPSINLDLPVSRQVEREHHQYYGYVPYWGTGAGPVGPHDPDDTAKTPPASPGEPNERPSDTHLQSAKEVTGYHVEGTDGSIGHVRDLVVDDETWGVHYLVLATANWWPSKGVLISPAWAKRVSWPERKVYVGMTREAIRASPVWSATYPVAAAYAEELYRHYAGTPGWIARDRSFGPKLMHAQSSPKPSSDAGRQIGAWNERAPRLQRAKKGRFAPPTAPSSEMLVKGACPDRGRRSRRPRRINRSPRPPPRLQRPSRRRRTPEDLSR